jgi:hypothetical protein
MSAETNIASVTKIGIKSFKLQDPERARQATKEAAKRYKKLNRTRSIIWKR